MRKAKEENKRNNYREIEKTKKEKKAFHVFNFF